MNDWARVATALLGSWPSQVASWGKEAIAAYAAELEARGVSADAALVAIRSCPAEQKFPPSAPELAALARRDPSRPTFDEAFQMIYGPGGVFGVKRRDVVVSPWVLAFVDRCGRERLRLLEVEHDDYGGLKRQELRHSWEQFLEANDGRELAAIAQGRRGELGRFDPLRTLPTARGSTGPRLEVVERQPAPEARGVA